MNVPLAAMGNNEPERPVTAGDVAMAAGVSLATVDRVLNGRPGVRETTSKAVKEAVERLGFKRDAAAANLARGRRYRLGVLIPRLPDNSFMEAVRQEIEAAALRGLDQRVSVALIDYTAFDPLALASRLDACADQGLDGMAVVAVDAPDVDNAIARLIARGVPVVTIVSDAPASRRLCFIGPDNVAAGRVAASLLGRFVAPHRGCVLTVAGRMTLRDHAERRLGFAQAIARDFPDLTLLPVVEGLDDRAVVKPLVAAALRDIPDLVGIYSMGAGNRGIAAALEEAGRAHDIIAIGHELTPFMRESLLGGIFDAAINQDAAAEVRRAVQTLRALADGQAAYRPDPIRIEIFLKDNLP